MADECSEAEPSSSRNFFDDEKKGRSRVKHEILQRYLKAWFAIMAQTFEDVVYVDGFAGPGKHKNGDNGSPILAYEIATQYKLEETFKGNIKLIFVELEKKQFKQLKENLRNAKSKYHGTHVTYEVYQGEFAKVLEHIYILWENRRAGMLVFADPFGFKGSTMPMKLMQKVMGRPSTEVFINVMDGSANRWFNSEKHESTLTELLGTPHWKKSVCATGINAHERLARFMKIYIKQLCLGNPECLPLKFAMKNTKNRHIYHLLYVTKHIKGVKEMKRAMWKNSQKDEEYSFSEWTLGKLNNPDTKKDDEVIVRTVVTRVEEKFRGKERVKAEEIERFIWLETPYVFNFKTKLKKELKPYILNGRSSSAFDMLVFHFPHVEQDPYLS